MNVNFRLHPTAPSVQTSARSIFQPYCLLTVWCIFYHHHHTYRPILSYHHHHRSLSTLVYDQIIVYRSQPGCKRCKLYFCFLSNCCSQRSTTFCLKMSLFIAEVIRNQLERKLDQQRQVILFYWHTIKS